MSDIRKKHDAFLSYSFPDVESVELIAQKINDLGIKVWLDRWSLAIGQDWKLDLESALSNSYAVLIFIGPNSISQRQREELCAGLDRKKKVIPILLPGCNWSDAPPLLKDLNFIDLRQSLQDQTEIRRLIAEIRQISIDKDLYNQSWNDLENGDYKACLLYTSPSPRDS